ncbi:MAG: bifunctional diaminohydroxyphosphoribosylaminopyrimidine deaminase/5-amino-6-(5-phosphoribosylamino)uracil reductase RibD [Campylobacteraceae bacterium]|nr:bifunctional diaminohydroxyphosphoribosylaminopyrimidine deaminase/5-amino-6-(5-phosphoribosylamino)uracil reductase RibD [Campylobacteraceae bacterium]
MEINAKFLELACKKAWEYQGVTYPNPAVGAAVVKNGVLISVGVHKRAGSPHAEVEALKSAYLTLADSASKKELLSKLQTSHEIHDFLIANADDTFRECDIYVTLEPCSHEGKTPSCAKLLSLLRPKRVIVGAIEQNGEASGGLDMLKSVEVDAIYLPSLACDWLIEPFFRWKNGGGFVFFKLALTMNGRVSGGKISSDASFRLVHELRDKTDLLVIGGNTVRVDRPTLDARLVGGKAPDLLIYSKSDNFARDIPLFGVKDRNVIVSSSFDALKNYNFVMIEGGKGMLEATKNIVSHYLFFISPEFSGDGDLDSLNLSFKILHSRIVDKDLLIWAKGA